MSVSTVERENVLVCTVSNPTVFRNIGVFPTLYPLSYWDYVNPELTPEQSWRQFMQNAVERSVKDHSGVIIDHCFNELPWRKELIQLAMKNGRAPVAIWFNGTPSFRVKKTAKPSPNEGWQRIYRYSDKKLVLMWDKLKNKKSDKLDWNQP